MTVAMTWNLASYSLPQLKQLNGPSRERDRQAGVGGQGRDTQEAGETRARARTHAQRGSGKRRDGSAAESSGREDGACTKARTAAEIPAPVEKRSRMVRPRAQAAVGRGVARQRRRIGCAGHDRREIRKETTAPGRSTRSGSKHARGYARRSAHRAR